MGEKTYNGWTNYATWRVNLEIFDEVCPEDFGLEEGEELKCTDLYELADAFKERAEYYVECSSSEGLARDYALAFLQDVNWYEIAEKFVNNYAEA